MIQKTQEIAGTSLQGYTHPTTRALLTAVLGEPITYEEGDKVTIEWGIRLGSTIATVYDWKRYELGTPANDEVMRYHIGGNNENAVILVDTLIQLARKLAL
jgi:hypothetical protein